MPKHFSHLKNMTSHQRESQEHQDATHFAHYVGPFGSDVQMTSAIRRDDTVKKKSSRKNY